MSEPAIRALGVVAVFVAMALWELVAPARGADLPRSVRWPGNLGIAAASTLAERILMPAAAVGGTV